VDEPLARRLWPGEDAVGQQLQFASNSSSPSRERFEVVGVVPGVRQSVIEHDLSPHFYLPFGSQYVSGMTLHVRVRNGDPRAEARMLEAVAGALRTADPDLPLLASATLATYVSRNLELWLVRAGAWLFTAFGLVALGLTIIGVYGLKAYLVARRTREIGVRMALGATRGAVLGHFLRESARLTVVGLAIGLVLATLCGRIVSGLLYQVSPSEPLVLAGALLVLAGAALLAAGVPAWLATRVGPAAALRTE
jgi:cell division protein FtsX